jgi:hypothetical protein
MRISICGFGNSHEYNIIEAPFQILLKKNITEMKYQIHKEILYKFNLKLRNLK